MSGFQSPQSPENGDAGPRQQDEQQQVMSAQAPQHHVLEGETSGPTYSTQDVQGQQRPQEQLPNGVDRELRHPGPSVSQPDYSVQQPGRETPGLPPALGVVSASEGPVSGAHGTAEQSGVEASIRIPGVSDARSNPQAFSISTPPPPAPPSLLSQQQATEQHTSFQHTMLPELQQPMNTASPLTSPAATVGAMTRAQHGGTLEQIRTGFEGDPRLQWPYPNPFQPQGDPPPLPPAFREEPERQGVWSGLARAGQALRRRMIGTGQSTHPSPEGSPPPPVGLMQPSVARAMYEWTARTSLISPGQPQLRGQDQASHTSSINQEMILQEVRHQVREAMKEKELEMTELRGQNKELKEALQSSLRALEDLKRDGGDRGQERQPTGYPEVRGSEPDKSGEQGDRGPLRDPLGRRLLHEQPAGNLTRSGLSGATVGDRRGDPAGLHRGEDGSLGTGGPSAGSAEPRRAAMEGKRTEEEDPLHLLAEGMRQLQLAYLGRSEKDSDVKGNVEVPMMPEVGTESAVEFSDWVYETEQAVGSLSDRASGWFATCLELARRTYDEYVNASPIERLTLDVVVPEELRAPQWARLEKKVMTLLLGAMTKVAKDDVITHRVRCRECCIECMFSTSQVERQNVQQFFGNSKGWLWETEFMNALARFASGGGTYSVLKRWG